jgi:hypothetical protein
MTIASIYLFGRRRLSILVTSHFEEKQIRERCEKLSIKLIPKAMAELVPIENRIITKEKPS